MNSCVSLCCSFRPAAYRIYTDLLYFLGTPLGLYWRERRHDCISLGIGCSFLSSPRLFRLLFDYSRKVVVGSLCRSLQFSFACLGLGH